MCVLKQSLVSWFHSPITIPAFSLPLWERYSANPLNCDARGKSGLAQAGFLMLRLFQYFRASKSCLHTRAPRSYFYVVMLPLQVFFLRFGCDHFAAQCVNLFIHLFQHLRVSKSCLHTPRSDFCLVMSPLQVFSLVLMWQFCSWECIDVNPFVSQNVLSVQFHDHLKTFLVVVTQFEFLPYPREHDA